MLHDANRARRESASAYAALAALVCGLVACEVPPAASDGGAAMSDAGLVVPSPMDAGDGEVDGGSAPADAGGDAGRAPRVDAGPSRSAMFGPQSSSAAADWGFDFVETFDGLSDWVRTEGSVGNVHDVARMPKLLDGSDSAWGYYSAWSDATPPSSWIGAFGDERVWRGTKSAAIDLGGAAGPSRFGLYMGEGYDEFHLFFMVNVPRNEFPTSCAGGRCRDGATGTYTEGESYAYFGSWKFNTFNLGCPSALCPDRDTYSEHWHLVAHLKQNSYATDPGIMIRMEGHGDDSMDRWANAGDRSLNDLLGDWFGIEYHVTQLDAETVFDAWVYDQDGTATQVLEGQRWTNPASARGQRWNQFFFGGNNSNTYSWGPTMQSVYYIDDVIIDEERIGPRYFEIIR